MMMMQASQGNKPVGYALTLDGVDESVDFGNHVFGERTSPVSIANWVKGDGFGHAISKQNLAGAVGMGTYNGVSAQGEVLFFIQGAPAGGNALLVRTTAAQLSATAWVHVVCTYDGSSTAAGVKIYINGSAVATTTLQDNLSASSVTTTGLTLGARPTPTAFLAATLAQWAVYNKALSAAEVGAIYSGRQFADCLVAGPTGNLTFYVPIKASDTVSAIADVSSGALTGTPSNLESGDFALVRLPALAA